MANNYVAYVGCYNNGTDDGINIFDMMLKKDGLLKEKTLR